MSCRFSESCAFSDNMRYKCSPRGERSNGVPALSLDDRKVLFLNSFAGAILEVFLTLDYCKASIPGKTVLTLS